MARRRKKDAGMDLLLTSPWWVSALLAVGGYIGIKWILPASLKGPAQMAGNAFAPLGTLVAIIFGAIAVVLYFKQRSPKSAVTGLGKNEPWVPGTAPEPPPARSTRTAQPNTAPPAAAPTTPVSQTKPTEWSLTLLRTIEWKRFEEVTAAYFREKTFRTETIKAGADGGIDVKLFVADKTEPFAIVQCKAWNSQQVGVKLIRELLGVMAHEKVSKGIFVTTADYTADAKAFAKENPISLITGEMLIKGISALSAEAQLRLLTVATEGEYTTPTCASCGIKMVSRSGPKGNFWGCSNYPRCKQTLPMKSDK